MKNFMAEDNNQEPSGSLLLNQKETVGKISQDLLVKADPKQGIVDTERTINKDYFDQCKECVERKPHSEWTKPWFLIILNKKERLLTNVVRRYFFGRKSLPSPEYDQTVWHYFPSTGDMKFLWTLPDKETCHMIYNNRSEIPTSENKLAKFVIDFFDNRLYSSTIEKLKNI